MKDRQISKLPELTVYKYQSIRVPCLSSNSEQIVIYGCYLLSKMKAKVSDYEKIKSLNVTNCPFFNFTGSAAKAMGFS